MKNVNEITDEVFMNVVTNRFALLKTEVTLVRPDNQAAINELVTRIAEIDAAPSILNDEQLKFWYGGPANRDFGITVGNYVEDMLERYDIQQSEINVTQDNNYVQIINGQEVAIDKAVLVNIVSETADIIDTVADTYQP